MHNLTVQSLTILSPFDVDYIFACYTIYLATGHTFYSRRIQTDTIKRYLKAAHCPTRRNPTSTFSRLVFPPLVQDILTEHSRWESIPNRREPVTMEMVRFWQKRASTAHQDSFDDAFFDWMVIGIQAGFRKSEWVQDSHHFRSTGQFSLNRDGSSKAFLASDFSFTPLSPAQKLNHPSSSTPHSQVNLTWRFQKNNQNNQRISFNHNFSNESFSPVLAAQRILDRARRLQVPPHHPVSVFFFKTKKYNSCITTSSKLHSAQQQQRYTK